MKSIVLGVVLPVVAAAIGTVAILGSVGLVPGFPVWGPLYEAAVSAKTVYRLPTATPTPTPEPPTKAPTRVPATPQLTATPRATGTPTAQPTQKPAQPAPPTPKPVVTTATPVAGSTTRQTIAAQPKPAADASLKSIVLQLSDLSPGFAQTKSAPVEGGLDSYAVHYERGDTFIDNVGGRWHSVDEARTKFADLGPPVDGALPNRCRRLATRPRPGPASPRTTPGSATRSPFAKGPIVVSVTTGGSAAFDDTLRYAKLVADRIR